MMEGGGGKGWSRTDGVWGVGLGWLDLKHMMLMRVLYAYYVCRSRCPDFNGMRADFRVVDILNALHIRTTSI